MKKFLTTVFSLLTGCFLMAQATPDFWQDVDESQIVVPEGMTPATYASQYRTLSLDLNALVNHLREAPMEFTSENSQVLLDLPMPDGSSETIRIWESPVMEPALAGKFPMIKTFAGTGLERTNLKARLGYGVNGFHAIVQMPGRTALINTYYQGNTAFYVSYYLQDVDPSIVNGAAFTCGVEDAMTSPDPAGDHDGNEINVNTRSFAPVDLYKYRLAVATTVEYSSNHGNTVASVMSDVVMVVDNVNSVFERDAAIRLELVDNTEDVFFFGTPGSDDYTNGNTSAMIDENPPVLNNVLGSNAYDIGHVFGTNGGGLAATGSVCGGFNSKARGVSCTFGPYTGALFYIVVGHEIGHQFNALHNFNKCDDDNESPTTAYEPGSGSTIMCYNGNGVCGDNHLQPTTDDYFHINAMERIRAFSRNDNTGGTCAEIVSVGNNMPVVDIPIDGGFYIPISTPFELTGDATDPEGDDMTFVWEQYDLGPASPLGDPMGTAPLFRSKYPGPSPTRIFPDIFTIVNNEMDDQEILPFTTRPLTFRFTARDNNPEAGAYSFEQIGFNATETAGPFLVTSPNTGNEVWEVGEFREVTWDVANTNGNLVNCQRVNIKLSNDGGFNFPITLLSNTLNDGSAFVTVPDTILPDAARIRVEAADNIFFDMSNENFSIVAPSQPGFAFTVSPEMLLACTPETITIDLETSSLMGFAENISFDVDGLPAGAVATFSDNPVAPGDNATLAIDLTDVTEDGNFDVTITATANGVPDAERHVSLNVVYNDFSALELITPAGASGISVLPLFSWSDLPNGLTYDIEIATDPAFTNIIDEATDLSDPNYEPSVTLEEDQVYYWRVRVSNECGTGDYSDAAAFKTVSQSCSSYENTTSQNISGSGLPVIESVVNIASGGDISDVNLKNIAGIHNAFGDIEFFLTGPDGTGVKLMSKQPCGSASGFLLGFDDQSPVTSIPCPPSGGQLFKPEEPLSVFNGTDSQGDWKFELKVVNEIGAGGTFEGWELEVCGAFAGQDPFVVTNEVLAVPPDDSRLIYQNKLLVEDNDNTSNELVFTIIKNTESGYVSRSGVQLQAGDQFTMMDINASQITYTNTDPGAESDYFTFTVDDGNGGFLGTPAFNIVIDENAEPSAADEAFSANDVRLYPNPASGVLNIGFRQALDMPVTATIFNVQGQVRQSRQFDRGATGISLEVGQLTPGLYLVQLASGSGIVTKKIVVDR